MSKGADVKDERGEEYFPCDVRFKILYILGNFVLSNSAVVVAIIFD